jgi:Rrf2 family iron-sulfur cluster assembly transcriptional regulator
MITTKSRYALRAILDIARHQGQGAVRRSDIARRQDIPRYYLERILLMLRDRGMLRSRKGPGGGFVLGRPIEGLTVWDVIEAVGEGGPPLECLVNGDPDCGRHDECDTRGVWARLYNRVRLEMRSIHLADVLRGSSRDRFEKDVDELIAGTG